MELKATKDQLREIENRIQTLFLADDVPWVIGYSGGKDSTAVLQLVWYALKGLPVEQRLRKPVHVISTDTWVEQPIVAFWVQESLSSIEKAAMQQDMPFRPYRLSPELKDSYWVKLIGVGYPAPRMGFRWCTYRLKIRPSNKFILEVVKRHGEAILVLGTRKAESAVRAANMERYEKTRVREWLSPNASLPNSWVFTPIEDWTSDDVWFYLMQNKNPWDHSNKDLLSMYRGASVENECPLVVDTSTPSCGNSRFGCWVCTLVDEDKSMAAMIQNDQEKVWMAPMLDYRNKEIGPLDEASGRINDYEKRDYRRSNGTIKLNHRTGRTIRGPYLKAHREHLLKRLLEVQAHVQKNGPTQTRDLRLITDDELREIRRIWVVEKHEFDDSLPRIYQKVTGEAYPFIDDLEPTPFGESEWKVIEEIGGGDHVYMELLSSLLDIEQRGKSMVLRRRVIEELEDVIRRSFYVDEEDAIAYQSRREQVKTIGNVKPSGILSSQSAIQLTLPIGEDEDHGTFEEAFDS